MQLRELTLTGFKSFAKSTRLVFGSGITAIIGPNGQGKCVHGDTQIPLHNGRVVSIRDLFDEASALASDREELADGTILHMRRRQFTVLSLNTETLTMEQRPVSAVIRRTSPGFLLQITTRSGRTIKTTHYHPFFSLKHGQLYTLTAKELQQGVMIAVPSVLPITVGAETHDQDKILAAFAPEDNVYIPYYRALEGWIRARAARHGSLAALARNSSVPIKAFSSVTRTTQQAILSTSLVKLAGERIHTLPRVTHLKSRGRGWLRIPTTTTVAVAKVLGYVISEGYIAKSTDQIRVTQNDRAVLEDFTRCMQEAFRVETKIFSYSTHALEAIAFSRIASRFLARVYGLGIATPSAKKRIPPQIMRAPKSIVMAFLSALYEGDGYIKLYTAHGGTKTSTAIEYTTASQLLAHDLVMLLSRFHIFSSVRCKYNAATNTIARIQRPYYTVIVTGHGNVNRLRKMLTFVGTKQTHLDRLAANPKKGPTVHDRIPSVVPLVRQLLKAASVKIKPLRNQFPRVAAYNEQRCAVTRLGLQETLMFTQKYGKHTRESEVLADQLQRLAQAEVVWDEVVRIEKIDHEDWVYDLTVADHHNFVANNIIVHNSNIADGIRWVLGEQSLKSLRGKSSTDIIFAGSDTQPRKGSATASLLLLNDDERLPIDAAEVLLERMIDRSGESEYLLNSDPVRLSDLQHMLAVAGLGTRSYAVISQGTVDQYLTATPKARRELFDEATGIKALQIKLRQAEGKLAQANERANELQAVLQELKPRLTVLQRQVNRHQERQELEVIFKRKQEHWYHQRWHELSANIQDHQTAVQRLRSEVLATRQARERAEADMLEAAQAQQDHNQEHTDTRQQLERDLLVARQALERAQQTYDEAMTERTELAASLQRISIARRDAERQLAYLRASDDTDTLFARVRATLTQMSELLTAWRHGSTLREDAVHNLEQAIQTLLQELQHDERTVLAATSLLERLEGPLQAVARLQAVEEERRQRLATLPEPILPDSSAVERLQALLQTNQSASVPAQDLLLQSKRRLHEAREAEVVAERSLGVAQAELTGAQADLEAHEAAIRREAGTSFLQQIQLSPPDTAEVVTHEELQQLQGRLAALGEIDPLALQEYQETEARYTYLSTQLEDTLVAKQKTEQLIRNLKRTIETQFREQFLHIRHAFGTLFTQLFGGGSATLEIVEEPVTPADTTEEEPSPAATVAGVEITARPPGKKPSHIGLLSGGERALTSLALVLAIMQVQRPPFLVLDEVDVALDEANSFRFAQLLQEFKKHTQVIIITHNRETMGQADILYGVTMQEDGVSRVYSVKMEEIQETEEMTV